jgi:ATP-binding cassette, subfamily C (CFTR/MRP), member 4
MIAVQIIFQSSFLMSLLGELPLSSGSIDADGRVAFASQEPWSFNDSVRNNILFGSEFDETRFKEIVHVCALEKDFELFPYGDKTLVGERGVSLSGGQKARITLARFEFEYLFYLRLLLLIRV